MKTALKRALDLANAAMSNNLHNYGGAGFLALTLLIGVVVLTRWLWTGIEPGSGILDLFLYAGGLYCTTQGLAGGIHTYKSVKGATGMNTPASAAAPGGPDA